MRTANGWHAPSFVDVVRSAAPSSTGFRRVEERPAFASGNRGGAHFESTRPAFGALSAGYAQFDDVLAQNDFLKDVHREKNRAERSGVALSLVVFQFAHQEARHSDDADRLLGILHDTKRKTDIIGHLGDNMIAVLCPDTDEHGTQAFIHKIGAQAGQLPYAAIAATYPDNLFEHLARGTRTPPPFQVFVVSEGVNRGGDGYPLKRSLDIAGALAGLCLLAPLLLLVAAAIAFSSPGPVIFKQKRLGKGGIQFTFYKFRSMTINGDDRIHRAFVARLITAGQAERAAAAGMQASYKLQSDPRITPLGRFLRKTSIDELPQLFNVLKGDMSLVGPRPPIPYEAAHYQSWHLQRILTIKPGITGLWQVAGRSRVSFNEMVRMDLRYIHDCSLKVDLAILLKTVGVVARCDGAV